MERIKVKDNKGNMFNMKRDVFDKVFSKKGFTIVNEKSSLEEEIAKLKAERESLKQDVANSDTSAKVKGVEKFNALKKRAKELEINTKGLNTEALEAAIEKAEKELEEAEKQALEKELEANSKGE